ncbi:WavE lipopolysaccharide synthesis family protein [Butyrivibrio sp. YAB3001]|uniref:WavE lipopolysaccharide synthesis family protein n=1 Tax=Butyrivibrio sp. YAB3001 TaxID=1520812 RepID=UPI0008F64437|nr:WavE lipopolysaccharide synthesis family protein [Butyrivibrio sp. YAB3001]SFB95280.1 WavE lipopolysaccharide synthesis [Butyrivibrio sp. YAB3001]
MDNDFTTEKKNILFENGKAIILDILFSINRYKSDGQEEKLIKSFTFNIQKLNVLARLLTDIISSVYKERNYVGINIYCDDELECKMQNDLKNIISIIISLIQVMSETNADSFNEKRQEMLMQDLKKFYQELRYGFLSIPQMEVPGKADLGNVYAQLEYIGKANGDRFQVRNMWLSSSRRFLHNNPTDDVAIVMQGPILKEDNFTIETLIYYRTIYPYITMILSTWKGEVSEEISSLCRLFDIIIVENEKRPDGGPWNIRYQFDSTNGGIRKLSGNKQIKYVFKTRTDQIILLPDFLIYMKNMINLFPIETNEMKKRIIFLGGYASMCTYPFRITDFQAFGHIDDIRNYYDNEDSLERLEYTVSENETRLSQYLNVLARSPYESFYYISSMGYEDRMKLCSKIGKKQDPESFIVQSFYERVILKRRLNENDDLLQHYWKFVKECTIFIDSDELLFYWNKYSDKYIDLSSNISDGGLTHSTWLSIYMSGNVLFKDLVSC